MARIKGQAPKTLLAGAAVSAALCGLPAASAQIGGFDTELPAKKKRITVTKQRIVDVRSDPSWDGPKSLDEALKIVKSDGEIVIHPGRYRISPVTLSKNVTIRGLDDAYGEAPTLIADRGCLSVRSDRVSARVDNLAFRHVGSGNCIKVSAGRFDMANTEVLGRRAGTGNISEAGAGGGHLERFSVAEATNVRSALVAVTGGEVLIERSRISGGETGLFYDPGAMSTSFQNIELRETTISGHAKAGVVMVGEVDATLTNNAVLSNGMGGIVYSGSGHARFVGNTISNNAFNGLYIQGADRAAHVERNKIHDNSLNGIAVGSGTAVLVANDIGEHLGCRVREQQVQAHTNITLFEDGQGLLPYANADEDCRGDATPSRKRRRGRGR